MIYKDVLHEIMKFYILYLNDNFYKEMKYRQKLCTDKIKIICPPNPVKYMVLSKFICDLFYEYYDINNNMNLRIRDLHNDCELIGLV